MHQEIARVYAALKKNVHVIAATEELRNPTEDTDREALERVILDACSCPDIRLKSFSEILSSRRRSLYEAHKKHKSDEIEDGALADGYIDEDEAGDIDESEAGDGDGDGEDDHILNLRKSTMSKEDGIQLETHQTTVQVDQCRYLCVQYISMCIATAHHKHIASAPNHLVQQQNEFLESLQEHIMLDGHTRLVAKEGNETVVPDTFFLVYGKVVPAADDNDFLINANYGVVINERFRPMIIAEKSRETCTTKLESKGRFCSGVLRTTGWNAALPFSIMQYTFVLPRKLRCPRVLSAKDVAAAEADKKAKEAHAKEVAKKCERDKLDRRDAENRSLERRMADETKQREQNESRLRKSRSRGSQKAGKGGDADQGGTGGQGGDVDDEDDFHDGEDDAVDDDEVDPGGSGGDEDEFHVGEDDDVGADEVNSGGSGCEGTGV